MPPRRLTGRDALGRPVAATAAAAVPPVPEDALPPGEALALALALVDAGRAFAAHEVCEAVWKAPGTPPAERDLWRGLAQLCVGVTHRQRGNAVGAAALLDRGHATLAAWTVEVPAAAAAYDGAVAALLAALAPLAPGDG